MEQPSLFDQPRLKRCSKCKQLLPLDQFHRQRKKKDGLQQKCKTCNIEDAKRFHAENPEHCRKRIAKRARKVRDENQQRVMEYLLTHPCLDCGEDNPIVLEFDHLRDKIANVSALLMKPWLVIEAEIAKCDVVCANCHRLRTAERLQSFRFRALQGSEDDDR